MGIWFVLFTSGSAWSREAVDDPSGACESAVRAAELRYDLPHGILQAIALAESGRVDTVARSTRPWPWTVQAEGESHYFNAKADAVDWVRAAQARGTISIDTGCMQVNLQFHPAAFPSLEAAFDPPMNADYAARFLRQLRLTATDWEQAVGFYHSHTEGFAVPYRRTVARLLGQGSKPLAPFRRIPPSTADRLASAWHATIPQTTEVASDGFDHTWGLTPKPVGNSAFTASWKGHQPYAKGQAYAFN